ncbi:hypothetical protein B9G54_04830 [Alloscardovia macacae]|uniref:Ribbon-helix-helix protein CopG domain-containing protein n=1 Tax=Alloscardovia macacae TaxID=1160091 RepID=A0A1Y2SXL8_9BIFI|nr:hypothetical protein [Alloscardovia macacae]OTA26516.1 hypothetical protein B9G54_04830 [Alloscardovia macacae]OTA29805.1 hypothetical protein B9T39_01620 [Alloscardovia macacae]
MTARDEQILAAAGLSLEEIERQAAIVESEDMDDELTGVFYTHYHAQPSPQSMTTISLRLPESLVESITDTAHRLNLTRSEYIRRKLAA